MLTSFQQTVDIFEGKLENAMHSTFRTFLDAVVACVLLSFFPLSAIAAEPAWWTKQKQDCGLPANLAYNSWDGRCDAIPKRQSTRADYDGKSISTGNLQTLARAAVIPSVDLVLITDRPQMDRVRDLVVAGNSAQVANAAFVQELKKWLRFSRREAMQTGDGLFSGATGNPSLPA